MLMLAAIHLVTYYYFLLLNHQHPLSNEPESPPTFCYAENGKFGKVLCGRVGEYPLFAREDRVAVTRSFPNLVSFPTLLAFEVRHWLQNCVPF